MKISEHIWNRFEQALARRERIRYLITGTIKTNTKPNVMIKTESGWRLPSLKGNNQS